MGKMRPSRTLPISPRQHPPGYDPKSGRLPRHGELTRHHMYPSSQGGQTVPSNLLGVPDRIHQAWHYLFMNMTPEQVMAFVATYWSPAGYFDMVIMRQGDKEIRLTRVMMLDLFDEQIERSAAPSFRDNQAPWSRQPYIKKRKRGIWVDKRRKRKF